MDGRERSRSSFRSFFIHSCRKRLGVAGMAIGSCILRTLEPWRRGGADRLLRDHDDRWLYVPLSALSSLWTERALGDDRGRLWRISVGPLLGRAPADVYLCARQPAALADRSWRISAETSALDSSFVSSVAESARRIRPRPRIALGIRGRFDGGDS